MAESSEDEWQDDEFMIHDIAFLRIKSKERFKKCFDNIIEKYEHEDNIDDEVIDIFDLSSSSFCNQSRFERCFDPLTFVMSKEEKQCWKRFKSSTQKTNGYNFRSRDKKSTQKIPLFEDIFVTSPSLTSKDISKIRTINVCNMPDNYRLPPSWDPVVLIKPLKPDLFKQSNSTDCINHQSNERKRKLCNTSIDKENLNISAYDSLVYKFADMINMSFEKSHKHKKKAKKSMISNRSVNSSSISRCRMNVSFNMTTNKFEDSVDEPPSQQSQQFKKVGNFENRLNVAVNKKLSSGKSLNPSYSSTNSVNFRNRSFISLERSILTTPRSLRSVNTSFNAVNSPKIGEYSCLTRKKTVEFNDMGFSSDEDGENFSEKSLCSKVRSLLNFTRKPFYEQTSKISLSGSWNSKFLTLKSSLLQSKTIKYSPSKLQVNDSVSLETKNRMSRGSLTAVKESSDELSCKNKYDLRDESYEFLLSQNKTSSPSNEAKSKKSLIETEFCNKSQTIKKVETATSVVKYFQLDRRKEKLKNSLFQCQSSDVNLKPSKLPVDDSSTSLETKNKMSRGSLTVLKECNDELNCKNTDDESYESLFFEDETLSPSKEGKLKKSVIQTEFPNKSQTIRKVETATSIIKYFQFDRHKKKRKNSLLQCQSSDVNLKVSKDTVSNSNNSSHCEILSLVDVCLEEEQKQKKPLFQPVISNISPKIDFMTISDDDDDNNNNCDNFVTKDFNNKHSFISLSSQTPKKKLSINDNSSNITNVSKSSSKSTSDALKMSFTKSKFVNIRRSSFVTLKTNT